jgi:hypothetical protein
MSKVRVYRFEAYDIEYDEWKRSRRYATEEAIAALGGRLVPDSGAEVDASVLDTNGMTPRDYQPTRRSGFQTFVERP